MVNPDPYSPIQSRETHPWQSDIATSNQRLLAFLMDVALLSPVFTLLLSGIYQKLKMQVYIGDTGPERGEMWLLWILSYYFLWVATTTLFLMFQGTTPGGRFLKLKLVAFNGQSPSAIAIVVRQMSFPLHLLFLGCTLFEIYFHEKQYAFHDKISETRWRSAFLNLHFPVGPFERQVVGTFVKGALVFCSLIFTVVLLSKYQGVRNLSFSRNQFLKDEPACEKAFAKFDSKDFSDLIFMNQTKFLPDSCMKAEIDLALYSSLQDVEKKSWAYFALARLSEDEEEKSSYEKLLCESNTKACQLLKYRTTHATTDLPDLKEQALFKYYQILNSIDKKHFAEALRLYQSLQKEVGYEIEALRLPILISWADEKVNAGTKAQRKPSSTDSVQISSDKGPAQDPSQFVLDQWNQFRRDVTQ